MFFFLDFNEILQPSLIIKFLLVFKNISKLFFILRERQRYRVHSQEPLSFVRFHRLSSANNPSGFKFRCCHPAVTALLLLGLRFLVDACQSVRPMVMGGGHGARGRGRERQTHSSRPISALMRTFIFS